MTGYRAHLRWLFVLAISCGLGCGESARAQESTRHLTGQVVSGFSGIDVGGDSVNSPYVGLAADLMGYWKDPRILTYDVNPNFVKGFQWAGPMSGPDSNGISMNSRFLGGSGAPLSVFFSHQIVPTPDLGPTQGVDLQGLSRTQQVYGADWSENFRHLPTFNIHYNHSDYTADYPIEFGGNLESAFTNLTAGTHYEIAKWQLNGNFAKSTSSAQQLGLLNPDGTPGKDHFYDRDIVGSASRELPLRSQVMFEGDAHDSSFDGNYTGGSSSYKRGSVTLSSRPTDRLTTSLSASYISNFADYALQRALAPFSATPQDGTLTAGSPLLNVESGVANYGAGLGFRIAEGLFARGSYAKTKVVSDSVQVDHFGEGETGGGGLSFFHKAFGGQFTTSYDFSKSVITVVTDNKTLFQAGTLGYSHPLPWDIKFSGNASLTNQEIHSTTFRDTVRGYGLNFDAQRRVTNGWDIRARADIRDLRHHYPTYSDAAYQTFGLSLMSKKTQLDISKSFDSGLAYQFGNGVILTPGATELDTVPGLPTLFHTNGTTLNIVGLYRIQKNFLVRGSFRTGSRTVNDIDNLSQHGFSVRTEYGVRKVHLTAGYARDWQQFIRQSSTDFNSRYFFFEIRRDFRLF